MLALILKSFIVVKSKYVFNYIYYISNTYYRYVPICGNGPLANPTHREMTSRPVPRDARCANVCKDDATAENQNDHSPGRPCGRSRDDAIFRYQSLYRRQIGNLLGRQTPSSGLGDQGPQTTRRLLAGLLRRPPG